MKKYILIFLFCMFGVNMQAEVQVRASAPDVVEVGEQFRLSFTINTQDVSNFSFPEVTGFSVDMGPSRSSESSFQIVNGRTSQRHPLPCQ